MDIEQDRYSDDDPHNTQEVKVKRRPDVDVRQDIANPKKYEHYFHVDSTILFEQKPSSDENLRDESKEIYTSKKVRKHLYDQSVNKARWKRTEEGKISSNARFVKWSDGTFGIYIGEEYHELNANTTANAMVTLQGTKDLLLSVAQLTHTSTLRTQEDLKL